MGTVARRSTATTEENRCNGAQRLPKAGVSWKYFARWWGKRVCLLPMRPAPIDFYEVLGLNQNASAEEIKSAYRRLAIQHHPDKQGDVVKFKEVNEANAVLGNPERRAAYDHERANALVEDITSAASTVVNEYFRQFARA